MCQHIINVIKKALNCGNIEYGYIKYICEQLEFLNK